MSLQRWAEVLTTAQVDGATLSNTAVQTSIIPAAAKFAIAGNYFDTIGKAVKVEIFGRISTLNPTPGNLTLSFRLGATDAASSGTMPLNTTAAKTNVAFRAECTVTCRSIGTAATLMYDWRIDSEAVALAITGVGTLLYPIAPVVGTAFDSTAAQTVDIQAAFSIASASNALTLHSYQLISLN